MTALIPPTGMANIAAQEDKELHLINMFLSNIIDDNSDENKIDVLDENSCGSILSYISFIF